MTTADQQHHQSRIIAGRYPPTGTSPIADAIRARRGPRGITPLDAALLHVPPIADGWNSLLGAVRTQGKLPGDVRELMILRVGALNGAAFEWIQHEQVGRDAGLTTAQLYVVRDIETPIPREGGVLSGLQTAALVFADESTRKVKVGKDVVDALMRGLRVLVEAETGRDGTGTVEERTEDLYVEASAVIATYNMVSRFLVAVDVAGLADNAVPWPLERKEHFVSVPSTIQDGTTMTHTIHAVTLTTSPTAPWIVFANSLLTDLTMWNPLIPFLLSKPYNILLHSQRGHGRSTLPLTRTTIPLLASDIAHLLKSLNMPTPVHAIVGVSQGGAAALAIARSWPWLTRSVVACDTAARTPAGNREAWAGRIGLVFGGVSEEAVIRSWDALASEVGEGGKEWAYAQAVGMKELARITVPRWFGPQSRCPEEMREWVKRMVERTSVEGFVTGAGALANYDLLTPDENGKKLFTSPIARVLVVAGSLDGGGKVSDGLKLLKDQWNAVRVKDSEFRQVEYVEIECAGHLPMIDENERFGQVLSSFLDGII